MYHVHGCGFISLYSCFNLFIHELLSYTDCHDPKWCILGALYVHEIYFDIFYHGVKLKYILILTLFKTIYLE